MKKILVCLFTILLLLTLGSCKKEESSVSLSNEETQKIQEVVEEKEEVVEETKQEEVFEEVKEEIKTDKKEEIDPEVLKTYKYWVVFYNPDGTELQREALKWGTTPKYYDGVPYYYDGLHDYDFVGWTNKKGQPKELKPITGNTYFYAKYEIGKVVHHSSGGGSNPPGPPPYVPNCTETTTLVKIIEHKYMLGSWQGYRYIIYEYNSVSGKFEESRTIPGGSYKTICGSTDYAGVELNKFYHATLGWSDTISWIGPECVTPGPDHGISVD